MIQTIIAFMKQPSTIRGLVLLIGAFGIALTPDQAAAIVTLAVAGLGVVEVFRDERKQ